MKERPILFSAPMVRAILEGRKTQTRRVVKPVGKDDCFVLQDYGNGWWPYRSDDGESAIRSCGNETPLTCPYGQPGDRLWVRETWAAPHVYDHLSPRLIPHDANIHFAATEDRGGLLWRPSIHMPRFASRILLEVVSVRVERLQDISRGDAMAEGCPFPNMADGDDPRDWFFDQWKEINSPESWDANPWVWVVEFRRGQP